MTATIDKEHHTYGGSSAKFWANCYAYQTEISKLPPQVVGEAAIKGTAFHLGALERKVKGEVEYLRTGKPFKVVYDDIPNWPVEGAEWAQSFWDLLFNNVLENIVTGKTIYIEHKLMFSEALDAGGTGDIVVLHKNDRNQVVLWVGDIKTGHWRVEPDDEQLLFYLCAANERAKVKGVNVEVFKSFIYQPTHSEPFTQHKFTPKEIERATKKYFKAIAESKKEKPKHKVGEWCRFCRAQAACTAYNKHVSKEMDLTVPMVPSVESLPDETIVKIWRAGDSIENYISAVRKYIIQRFSQGKPLEGLKIVSGVSKRKWADKDTAKKVLFNAGIDPVVEDIIGITEAEKRLKASGNDKKNIDAIMYTITTKPPAPPKVVGVEDERPAIDIKSVDLLSGLDEVEV